MFGQGGNLVLQPKMQMFQNTCGTTILLYTVLYIIVQNSCFQRGIFIHLSVNTDTQFMITHAM